MSDIGHDLDLARLDIAFLLSRAMAAGSCDFTPARWTGLSSNALVAVAYGGAQVALPGDRDDYAACVRTYKRLPPHRRTAAVRAALRLAREAYLQNHPEDRFPAGRAAKREQWRMEVARRRRRRDRRRA